MKIIAPEDRLVLCCDASAVSVAYAMFIVKPDSYELKLAQADSRLLKSTEHNKSSIGRELLAFLFTLTRLFAPQEEWTMLQFTRQYIQIYATAVS